MAYVTVNSTFRPYSFDEMLKPYQMYGEEFAKQQEAAAGLQAEAAKTNINKFATTEAKEAYSNYVNELNSLVDSIHTNGIDNTTKSRIYELNTNYWSVIDPMNKALESWDNLLKDRTEAKMKDRSIYFEKDYSSPDELINNPPDNTYYSGNQFGQNASVKIEAALKSLMQDPIVSDVGKSILTKMQFPGATLEQLHDIIESYTPENGYVPEKKVREAKDLISTTLADIIDDEFSAIGLDLNDTSGFTEDDVRKYNFFLPYASSALYSGLQRAEYTVKNASAAGTGGLTESQFYARQLAAIKEYNDQVKLYDEKKKDFVKDQKSGVEPSYETPDAKLFREGNEYRIVNSLGEEDEAGDFTVERAKLKLKENGYPNNRRYFSFNGKLGSNGAYEEVMQTPNSFYKAGWGSKYYRKELDSIDTSAFTNSDAWFEQYNTSGNTNEKPSSMSPEKALLNKLIIDLGEKTGINITDKNIVDIASKLFHIYQVKDKNNSNKEVYVVEYNTDVSPLFGELLKNPAQFNEEKPNYNTIVNTALQSGIVIPTVQQAQEGTTNNQVNTSSGYNVIGSF